MQPAYQRKRVYLSTIYLARCFSLAAEYAQHCNGTPTSKHAPLPGTDPGEITMGAAYSTGGDVQDISEFTFLNGRKDLNIDLRWFPKLLSFSQASYTEYITSTRVAYTSVQACCPGYLGDPPSCTGTEFLSRTCFSVAKSCENAIITRSNKHLTLLVT